MSFAITHLQYVAHVYTDYNQKKKKNNSSNIQRTLFLLPDIYCWSFF